MNKQIEEMAKIIDSIEGNAYPVAYGDEAEADSEKIAEALYNAGYRKQEWISVEERLPDCCGLSVLMVAVNQYSQTRVVKGFTDYQCPINFRTNEREFDGTWGAWDVTHWMPLPEAPKGGAE